VAELRFGKVHLPPHPARDALARQTHCEISTLAAASAEYPRRPARAADHASRRKPLRNPSASRA
jgi:hypothetical protein